MGNTSKILLFFVVTIGFGCTTKPSVTEKTGLEIVWQESKQPFWTFLKQLSFPYDNKVSLFEKQKYNAYGKVTLINHHSSTIKFNTFQEILTAKDSYNLPPCGRMPEYYQRIPKNLSKQQQLLPGDTAHFYLIFRRTYESSNAVFQPDSINHWFSYKLEHHQKNNADSTVQLNLMLKKTPRRTYVMRVKTVSKTPAQTTENIIPANPWSTAPLSEDFVDFAAHFPTLNFQHGYDPPVLSKKNIPPDSSALIAPDYMRRFIRRNLTTYRNPEDSLVNFVTKEELLKLSGQYVGKINHPNDHRISVLLTRLIDPTHYYTTQKHAYYILSYYKTATGDGLGYDLIGGFRTDTLQNSFQGRLHLKNQQLIIERTFYERHQNYGQKYTVSIGQDPKKTLSKKTSTDVTLLLTGEVKIKHGVKYKEYCDKRMGYCVDLPYNILTCATRTIIEGKQEEFISKNGQLVMAVYREEITPDTNAYQSSDSSSRKGHLDKALFTSFSSQENGIITYEKRITRQASVTRMWLVYPVTHKQRYAKIVQNISTTFR